MNNLDTTTTPHNSTRDDISTLRKLGLAEGLSYLTLLLIAMPIKYGLGEPLPVRIVGALHGLLFVVYVLMGVYVGKKLNWAPKMYAYLLLASILPGGPFVFDRRLKDVESGVD